MFLVPPFAKSLLTYFEVLGFVAEPALIFWLIVRGVNVQRWQRVASKSSQEA